ncbi:MAG: response regulator [Anaerolineae bacterium]|nr:response regulator [Anaerolineae bacterium]
MAHTSTILIVDDEPSARDTLQALLFNEGYELVFAYDGFEALAKASALNPDLVLLDVMMPGLDGFAVCQRLRADEQLAQVPVMMITALDDRDSRLRGIEAGADDFISKPFDRFELRARVRTVTQLNRYRQLLQERANFEWVIEQSDDGYMMLSENDEVLYANPQAQLYLNLPETRSPDKEQESRDSAPDTFLELARKHYQLEPQALWGEWPRLPDHAPPAARYLVRPESPNANAFWLQVDILKMTAGKPEKHLIRLRDITSSITTRNNMWSFHGIINHKLRTPANIVTGFLNLLTTNLSKFSTERLQETLSTVQESAERLQGEILNILQYVDAIDMDTQDVHLCGLDEIDRVISETKTELDIENIQTRYTGWEDPAAVLIKLSRQGLKLILGELLGNAKKFHPEKSPIIEVNILKFDAGVCIQVQDNGATLAPDQLAMMWMPYYQADKYFTGQVAGSGLGLAVVASLVWNAGGTCHARNRDPGAGVIVELVLPVVMFDEEAVDDE